MDNYDGDLLKLAESDQFVLLMKTAPFYVERIKSIMFKYNCKKDMETIDLLLDSFYFMLDFIQNDQILRDWLEILLAHGNYLNGTSVR